ncbi:hypothetical protein G5714_002452 [Onychostoma macrolepis]|uniref:Secreted protein n=1 Tax=Onychostoma macrolepis TaxID=369639 RepID=A0A7J6DF66_9TELE|nr:hypothetical protein G5714_002452 [Onychostoma macrolepis]
MIWFLQRFCHFGVVLFMVCDRALTLLSCPVFVRVHGFECAPAKWFCRQRFFSQKYTFTYKLTTKRNFQTPSLFFSSTDKEWNAQDCGISKVAKDTSMLPSKFDQKVHHYKRWRSSPQSSPEPQAHLSP